VEIETTRPELIPACVALVAHPDDDRYKPMFGTEVVTPLFGVKVPIKPHTLADPSKGSGIAMICTFGDVTDVVWWRELSLPVRAVIQADGTLRDVDWRSPGWRPSTLIVRAGTRGPRGCPRRSADEDREQLRESGDRRRAASVTHAVSSTRRRSTARDRHEPPVVHQDDRVPRAPPIAVANEMASVA
jgi:valyl-tRNA synthetase